MGTAWVVPAHAGVFPLTGSVISSSCVSSPRTRGCSHLRGAGVLALQVVPAHAGVFRGAAGLPLRGDRRPRARGGVPSVGRILPAHHPSSPRTRGCSPTGTWGAERKEVVPAHAGVFPSHVRQPTVGVSRPRARGGVPRLRITRTGESGSSPRTRGCSCRGRRSFCRCLVVPAHAGVFRTSAMPGPKIRASSPRTRGCSPDPAGAHEMVCVVPAHAGVFLRPERTGREDRSRPRARGGVPLRSLGGLAGRQSSPRTRGCSLAQDVQLPPVLVVPAHAGVFPQAPQAPHRPRSRPRARGGVPSGRGDAILG